ncbi:MAG: riboflavin biosynthesis protein RibD [Deltaproteobacteria bacterium CG11_big_fil_rev_8_21_14_0_20_47_16]|nr:MAG: riboflavin biosynthesis protein RibD [Deltaproteobacteria bacterium CG11_big_fil_rev_8_21_14_0_20_47_16]
MSLKSADIQFMQRALHLAEKALGKTSPNPMVGAVLVKKGHIIAEGFHRKAGTDHAEIVALKAAGAKAKGATLYVTLEPCCHQGRTGPCTEAIIQSGVKRVVYAMKDPNPQVAGKGLAKLRRAKIKVDGPICEDEACYLNRSYIHWMRTGTPYLFAKVAITMDGKMADHRGKSKWITEGRVREFTHYLRSMVDGIMVGAKTAIADDPQLTARVRNAKQPMPIVISSKGKLPQKLKILKAKRTRPTVILTAQDVSDTLQYWLSHRGHVALHVGGTAGKVNLRKALRELGSRGVTTVLLEGGPTLIGALSRLNAIQEWIFCMAPKFLGDAGMGISQAMPNLPIANAKSLYIRQVTQIDNAVIIVATQKF